MLGSNNLMSHPNMFKELSKRIQEKNVLNKDKDTAHDSTSIISKPSEIIAPLDHLKSDVKSAFLNPTTGSKTSITLSKNNDLNNHNRGVRDLLPEKSTPSNSLFENTLFAKNVNQNRAFGEKAKQVSGTHTDGIIGEKKTNIQTQAKSDLGLKVNRFQNNAKIGNLTTSGTPRINRQLDCSNQSNLNNSKCSSTDNTKLKPEIKPIG